MNFRLSQLIRLACVLSLLLVAQAAWSIEPRVVRLPGRPPAENESIDWGNWTVSYRQPYFPNSMLYSANHDTLAAAQASAQELIRTHKGEGKFRLSEVLIEGTPVYRPANTALVRDYLQEMMDHRGRREPDLEAAYKGSKAKQIGDYLGAREVKDGPLGSVLGDYGTAVQMAYDNAVTLKKKAIPAAEKAVDEAAEKTNQSLAALLGSQLDLAYEQQLPKSLELRSASLDASASDEQRSIERLLNAAAAADSQPERDRIQRELAEIADNRSFAQVMQREASGYSVRAYASRLRARVAKDSSSLSQALQPKEANPKPDSAPAPVGPKLEGTEWAQTQNLFTLRIMEFGPNGKVVGRFNVEASRKEGKWVATGPNTIKGDFGSFGDFIAELKDGRLEVKWDYRPGAYSQRTVLNRR
ncbi:MAG: hypothetical protein U0939_14275 [Pirellulales bacterium]